MPRPLIAYVAALLAVGVLDYLWLRVIATSWYEGGIGHLMAAKPNLWAAAAFYFLYPIGLVVFAALPANGDLVKALALGALFGLFCYGTYDVTNLAIMKDWPVGLTFIDMAWGAFVSAAGAGAAAFAMSWLSSRT